MPRTITKIAAAVVLGAVACPLGAAYADDVDMHKFWLDQGSAGQTRTTTANPSSRIPDTGRAYYQDENSGMAVDSNSYRRRLPRHYRQPAG